MDDFTDLLKTIDSADKKSIYDGYSVFEIQEENYIGKSVVGVMANGVKAIACFSCASLSTFLLIPFRFFTFPERSAHH